jgi:transcriptional regulator with XRE-family HTH domain
MNAVERIKSICKERKIPISKLERECGFANGYIGQLKKGSIPSDRLIKICDFLGIAPSALIEGADADNTYYVNPETAKVAQDIFENKDLRILFDAAKDAKPEDLKMAADMLKRFKETNSDG